MTMDDSPRIDNKNKKRCNIKWFSGEYYVKDEMIRH